MPRPRPDAPLELKARVRRHEVSTVIPVSVLGAFFEGPSRFTADDLARRSGVRLSSIYRWIYTMEELGWAERYDAVRTRGARRQVWRRIKGLAGLAALPSLYRP